MDILHTFTMANLDKGFRKQELIDYSVQQPDYSSLEIAIDYMISHGKKQIVWSSVIISITNLILRALLSFILKNKWIEAVNSYPLICGIIVDRISTNHGKIWRKEHLCPLLQRWINSSTPSVAYMLQWIGSALVQIMACRLFGAKPLPEPMLTYCQLNHWEETSVKSEWKFKTFHSWKCTWKCRLWNGGHFDQGELTEKYLYYRKPPLLLDVNWGDTVHSGLKQELYSTFRPQSTVFVKKWKSPSIHFSPCSNNLVAHCIQMQYSG